MPNRTASPPPADSTRRRAIGGYLELEFGQPGGELYPQAMAFQSARAAFLALLLAGKPERVWLPWYICEEMVVPALRAGVRIMRYGIDESFNVAAGVELERGDWLLYVNYFGLCDAQVDSVLGRFAPGQVVVDNSHALFSSPRDCLATIYSPRKFVGVPDGAYLISMLAVPVPQDVDTLSLSRCHPLLVRAAQSAEAGYEAYLRTQEDLSRQPPMRMSQLTHGFLRCIDYASVATRRRANYRLLDEALGGINRMAPRATAGAVPLGYPYLGGSAALRQTLVTHRVYVPRYWPHLAAPGAEVPQFERFLAEHCLTLPCDQRYAADELAEVLNLVLGASPDKPLQGYP